MMRTGRPAAESGANIIRAAHGEFRVTDLDQASAFYVDVLGFVESERTSDALYLRGLEERDHHSLVLRRAATPGAGHLAFRVKSNDDLDRLNVYFTDRGQRVRVVESGEEAGQG
ncbi:MAG: VOC family protein, partial [Vicinamibacterales bacterium]